MAVCADAGELVSERPGCATCLEGSLQPPRGGRDLVGASLAAAGPKCRELKATS